MNQKLIKWTIVLGACAVVLVPLGFHIVNTSWNTGSLISTTFPMLGLLAASLMWLHTVSGALEEWLKQYVDLDYFSHWSSWLILVSFVLHPLLFLILIKFDVASLFSYQPRAFLFGFLGFFMLITYDIGRALKKYNFFVRHWDTIRLLSTVGFLLTFFHSLALGSDLQEGLLRVLWIFYAVTAALATIYTYGIKRLLRS